MKLVIALLIPLAAHGQMTDNRDKELTCEGSGYRSQIHRCDVREQSFASTGHITADPGRNGGVTVKGWLLNDVLVRSRVEAWADSDAEANALIGQIRVAASGGAIAAAGPGDEGRRGWSGRGWCVSYEIFVPRISDVSVRAFNGGIHAFDVEGVLHLETTNGAIHLARVAGDVTGVTTNGAVHAELMGTAWRGRQLDLTTTNGGVRVTVPEGYSGHLQAETLHGGVSAGFPVTVTGRIGRRNIDTMLGSGGPLIHVSTVNGGVRLLRN